MRDLYFRLNCWKDKEHYRFENQVSFHVIESKQDLKSVRRQFDDSSLADIVRTFGGVYGLTFGPRLVRIGEYGQWVDDGDWLDDELFPPHPIEIFAMTMHEFNKEKEGKLANDPA